MIKYFVRTTGERTLDESFSQIEYELLIDTEHRPVKSFIKQLEYLDSLECDVVLLEDDIILCKDFKSRIEDAISRFPKNIINFFNAPTIYQDIKIDNNFSFQQCRYFPKGTFKEISKKLKPYINKNKVCPSLNKIAKENDFKIIQYRPCLVQHLDYNSLVGNNYGTRRTPYFIDYLDELRIAYEEAEKEENKQKLIDLMNQKFKGK